MEGIARWCGGGYGGGVVGDSEVVWWGIARWCGGGIGRWCGGDREVVWRG